MKHLKNINEDINDFNFINSLENSVTFYLHDDNNKKGFVMNIAIEDKGQMKELLNKNKIIYTISENDLPF
jgi:hypothetical protein